MIGNALMSLWADIPWKSGLTKQSKKKAKEYSQHKRKNEIVTMMQTHSSGFVPWRRGVVVHLTVPKNKRRCSRPHGCMINCKKPKNTTKQIKYMLNLFSTNKTKGMMIKINNPMSPKDPCSKVF
jgi:hypothetical protein